MKIKGIEKFTLIDYPEKIGCTIFLFGCNFRCGFCHNPELVLCEKRKDISKKEILEFLDKRKEKIEGVCISGGEPMLSLDEEFLKEIKSRGYLIKIDTNGSFPEKLKNLIKKNLVDFVAIDIKADKEKYENLTGVKVNLEKIEESVKLASKIDYELRTTIIENIHNNDEIIKMGKWVNELLGKKPKKFVLQGFKSRGELIEKKFEDFKDTSEDFLKKLKKTAENYFEKVEVRV
ncbi:MAG: anaerobic ribonucleoside-triphosphate reductase activating protein [archaeon]